MKNTVVIYIMLAMANISIAQQNGVGINTSNPQETLHIFSDKDYILKLNDGKNYNGNYTISSADSNGTFKTIKTDSFRTVKLLQTSARSTNYDLNNVEVFGNWQNTFHTFNLGPGRWSISITSVLNFNNNTDLIANGVTVSKEPTVTVEATIGEGDETNFQITNDIEGNLEYINNGVGVARGIIEFPLLVGMLKGVIVINNETSGNKSYRILVRTKVMNLDPNQSNVITSKKLNNFLRRSNESPQNQVYAIPLN